MRQTITFPSSPRQAWQLGLISELLRGPQLPVKQSTIERSSQARVWQPPTRECRSGRGVEAARFSGRQLLEAGMEPAMKRSGAVHAEDFSVVCQGRLTFQLAAEFKIPFGCCFSSRWILSDDPLEAKVTLFSFCHLRRVLEA